MDTFECPANGKDYVVKESKRSDGVRCTRHHYECAVVGDESHCIVALGAKDKRWVTDAFIGSGNDAYLFVDRENLWMIHETDDGLPPEYAGYALHYIVGTKAAKLRDLFDQNNKDQKDQLVWLYAPSQSQTREARREVHRLRQEKLRAIIKVKDALSSTARKPSKPTKARPAEKTKEPKPLTAAQAELGVPPAITAKKRRTRLERLGISRRHMAPIMSDGPA